MLKVLTIFEVSILGVDPVTYRLKYGLGGYIVSVMGARALTQDQHHKLGDQYQDQKRQWRRSCGVSGY